MAIGNVNEEFDCFLYFETQEAFETGQIVALEHFSAYTASMKSPWPDVSVELAFQHATARQLFFTVNTREEVERVRTAYRTLAKTVVFLVNCNSNVTPSKQYMTMEQYDDDVKASVAQSPSLSVVEPAVTIEAPVAVAPSATTVAAVQGTPVTEDFSDKPRMPARYMTGARITNKRWVAQEKKWKEDVQVEAIKIKFSCSSSEQMQQFLDAIGECVYPTTESVLCRGERCSIEVAVSLNDESMTTIYRETEKHGVNLFRFGQFCYQFQRNCWPQDPAPKPPPSAKPRPVFDDPPSEYANVEDLDLNGMCMPTSPCQHSCKLYDERTMSMTTEQLGAVTICQILHKLKRPIPAHFAYLVPIDIEVSDEQPLQNDAIEFGCFLIYNNEGDLDPQHRCKRKYYLTVEEIRKWHRHLKKEVPMRFAELETHVESLESASSSSSSYSQRIEEKPMNMETVSSEAQSALVSDNIEQEVAENSDAVVLSVDSVLSFSDNVITVNAPHNIPRRYRDQVYTRTIERLLQKYPNKVFSRVLMKEPPEFNGFFIKVSNGGDEVSNHHQQRIEERNMCSLPSPVPSTLQIQPGTLVSISENRVTPRVQIDDGPRNRNRLNSGACR